MGPGFAYSSVMTSPSAAISIGSLLSFAPWASDRQKRKDGMATKRRKKTEDLPVLHPAAAGIDVRAGELFVAEPGNSSPGVDVQARAFPYSASKRLHAFSACGSL